MKHFYPKQKRFIINCCALLLIVLTAVIIHSCKKDVLLNPGAANPAAVNQARLWYQKTYPVNLNKTGNVKTLSTTTDNDLSQLINPDWDHAAQYERFNKDVIELPLDPATKAAFNLKDANTNGLRYNKDYSRTAFLLLKDSSGYKGYVMTIIADSAYLKNDLSKLSHNSYSKRDTDFSGLVLYFTPKGKYVCGWKYLDGHIVSPSAAATNTTGGTRVQSVKLTEAQTCLDWFLVTYVNDVVVSEVYLYTTCTGGSTTPQGGGSPAPPSPCAPVTPPNPTPVEETTKSKIINVVQQGPAPAPTPGDGGGFPPPTDPGNSPCQVQQPVQDTTATKFCDNVNQAQRTAIQNDINTLKNSDCISKALYSSTGSSIASYCINTTASYQAGYNPNTKSIIIKDPSNVSNVALQEEFFHAYQDRVISGGTAQYLGAPGSTNIEFEAKVLRDANSIVNGSGGAYAVAGQAYSDFIKDITSNFTSLPLSFTSFQLSQYFSLMVEFRNQNSGYANTLIDPNLNPQSMFSLIDSSPCNH